MMVRLRSVGQWLLRHWFLALSGTLFGVLVLMPIVRPVIYEVTHHNAIDCGSLLTFGSRTPDGNRLGPQEIKCFVQAHQQCKAATLFQISQAVEGAGKLTFRTANRLGGCVLSVIGYEEGFCTFGLVCQFVPFIDSNCRAMQQEQDGLHFLNCGNMEDTTFTI